MEASPEWRDPLNQKVGDSVKEEREQTEESLDTDGAESSQIRKLVGRNLKNAISKGKESSQTQTEDDEFKP